jgi:hypothetical protein
VRTARSLVGGPVFVRYGRATSDRASRVALSLWSLGANWAPLVGRHPDDECTVYF